MLTIKNFINIIGKEFTLANGTTYIVRMANDDGKKYSFAVFPLMQNKVANVKESIIFELHKMLYNDGADYYVLSSDRLKYNKKVRKQNITLRNFVAELHMATADIINKRYR